MTAQQTQPTLSNEPFSEQAFDAWLEQLSLLWKGDQRRKLSQFRKTVAGRTDAFTYLRELHRGDPGSVCASIVSATVDRIQTELYDIADLFGEIRSLVDLLRTVLSEGDPGAQNPSPVCETYRIALDVLFEAVVRETSVVYELFSEGGTQALCVLDADGCITYANKSAERLLGSLPLKGRTFVSTLDPATREHVGGILDNLIQGAPQLESIKVEDSGGNTRTLSADFARIRRTTERSVYYVSIMPTSGVLGIEPEILEDFEGGVVRVDTNKTIYYANKKARRLLGRDPFEPVHVYDILHGALNRRKIDEELRKREAGRLGKYNAVLTRPSGRDVPVSVTAIPEFNAYGERSGSVAFFSSREQEEVSAELTACLHENKDWKEAAKTVCEVLMKHVNADVITIYRWTDDMRHASPIIAFYRDGRPFQIERRWFTMSDAQIRWNQNTELVREGDMIASSIVAAMSVMRPDDH